MGLAPTPESTNPNVVLETNLPNLKLLGRGKVRDVYEAPSADRLLIVTTDRISAFDAILATGIPDKGRVLTQMTLFWLDFLADLVPNHFLSADTTGLPPECAGRSMWVKKCDMFPVECVVRGYLSGSGWKDYKATGSVCGIKLPAGLKESDQLPEPIFTPATKAAVGEHDENVSFEVIAAKIGAERAAEVRQTALALYAFAAEYARTRGIIIADTKFEFGLDREERLVLIDEILTPDSSRFWPADRYQPGVNPPSFDKQYVRDYLETLDWNKKAPAPKLPADVIEKTSQKYREALERIAGIKLGA